MPKSWQRWVTILSSSSKLLSSSRNSMRSRADIFPDLCWRSRRSAPPPSSASVSRRFSSMSFFSRVIWLYEPGFVNSARDYNQRGKENAEALAAYSGQSLFARDLHGLVNAHGLRQTSAGRAGVTGDDAEGGSGKVDGV